jgi:hypothetical protein
MSAILHSITTDIENSRIKDNIKYWRWMSNIFHNKQDTMNLIILANHLYLPDTCNCSTWYCEYCNDYEYCDDDY